MPLRRRLLLIALAGILPLALIAGLCFVVILRDQRSEAERTSLDVARLSAVAINVEIQRTFARLDLLAADPELHRHDLKSYRETLRHVLSATEDWLSLHLADPRGRILIDASAQNRESVILDSRSFLETVRTGSRRVGVMVQYPDQRWAIPIRVPVYVNGDLRYVLTAMLSPDAILAVLRAQRLPKEWVASVSDANDLRVARSKQHAQFFGKPMTPSLAKLIASGGEEGIGEALTMDGTSAYTAYVRLPEFGWTVAVGLPKAQLEASMRTAFAGYGGGILLSILLAITAALIAARRINTPMAELLAAARDIGKGQPPSPVHSEIQELRQLGQTLIESANARQASERERASVLVQLERARTELVQRVADLQRLHELTNEVLRLPTLEHQLHATLAALCDFHEGARGLICLRESDREPPRLFTAHGVSRAGLLALEDGLIRAQVCETAVVNNARVILPSIGENAPPGLATWAAGEGVQAIHGTPMRSRSGRVLGAITLGLTQAREPSERELRLADLCAGLAVVLVERAEAEDEARESERKLRVALDSSPVPFNVLVPIRGAQGEISDFALDYANRAAAEALQLPAENLQDQRLGTLGAGSWQDGQLLHRFAAVMERREIDEFEFAFKQGEAQGWYRMVASPFLDRLAVWFEDVTQRKLQEQWLRDADRRKDEFLATLAHELRNPLAPIRQAAMLAGMPKATEAQKRWSQEVIERQVRHMALLLDDLLDVSRITRGTMQLRKSRIPLATVIDAALETTRPLLETKGHRLDLALPRTPLFVHADPLRLSQILANLLTNAAKYTDAGGEIQLRAHAIGEQVEIEVQDNGVGIAPEDQDAIFDMFSQVRGDQEHGAGGLGIGLALARALAQLHGGSLSVRSAGAGQGSCFTVRLPLASSAVSSGSDPQQQPGASLSPLRLLVADDNEDAAETLADLLRLEGHEVTTAFDGEQAIARFKSARPDIAIIDIGMPKASGYEVAQAIRGFPEGKAAKLIALTGWGQFKDQLQSIEAGFDRHLTKPVDPQVLLGLLTELSSAGGPRPDDVAPALEISAARWTDRRAKP